jgi:hypothetical protein
VEVPNAPAFSDRVSMGAKSFILLAKETITDDGVQGKKTCLNRFRLGRFVTKKISLPWLGSEPGIF